MVERGDEDSRPNCVLDSARVNDPIIAEMAIKPGVIEKFGSLFGDPITVRFRGAEKFFQSLACLGTLEM